MKQKREPPLRLTPRFSMRLAAYLTTTHLAAWLVVLSLVRPWWLMLGLTVAILVSYIRSYRCHLLFRGVNAIRSAEISGEDEWQLQQINGNEITAQLQPNSYLHPKLSVLNFRSDQGKRQSMILLPDGIDEVSFRRLRVRLKMGSTAKKSA